MVEVAQGAGAEFAELEVGRNEIKVVNRGHLPFKRQCCVGVKGVAYEASLLPVSCMTQEKVPHCSMA